jgi:hypothetical protein
MFNTKKDNADTIITQFLPLQRMWQQRICLAREESDATFFYDLMFLGECLVKFVTAGMLGAIVEERNRHRYRLEYGLVRAHGIGAWTKTLEDALVGPASQDILNEAQTDHRDLSLSVSWGG